MGSVMRVLGVVALIWLIGFLMKPPRFGRPKKAELVEAINNGKQMWLALADHQKRYGSFPNGETMQKIVNEKGIASFSLVTSNDYFRVLVAGGLDSEKMGYCHYPRLPTHKPDNVISPLEQAFAKGEVGFAYVANVPPDAPAETPILVAPLIPGTFQFDPKPYDGHAIVIRLDGSARSMTIRKDNGLVAIPGATLFHPKAPYWNGKVPAVKYPAR